MNTKHTEDSQAVAGQVERPVRPLVERLRDSVAWLERDGFATSAGLAREAAAEIDQALHEAIAAVYFDDSSDYPSALRRIVRILGGPECAELLDANPRACYEASAA